MDGVLYNQLTRLTDDELLELTQILELPYSNNRSINITSIYQLLYGTTRSCINLHNIQLDDIHTVPSPCIVTDEEGYCFDVNELIEHHIDHNPYTRKKFTEEFNTLVIESHIKCQIVRKLLNDACQTQGLSSPIMRLQSLRDTLIRCDVRYVEELLYKIDLETLKNMVQYINTQYTLNLEVIENDVRSNIQRFIEELSNKTDFVIGYMLNKAYDHVSGLPNSVSIPVFPRDNGGTPRYFRSVRRRREENTEPSASRRRLTFDQVSESSSDSEIDRATIDRMNQLG